MEQRPNQWWAARVAVLLTVLGLVGMHGLPDAMASSTGGSMTATASMIAAPTAPAMSESASARHPGHGDRPARTAAVLRGGSRVARPGLASPMGCGMDHANCVAVLRDSGHMSTPGVSWTVANAALSMPRQSLVSIPARGPRAPPDVSLIDLGISRT